MKGQSRAMVIGLVLLVAVGVGWYRSTVFKQDNTTDVRPTLAVVTGGSGPYWQLLSSGAKAAGVDLGAEVQVLLPEQEEDIEGQMRLLYALDLDSLDGVALSPLDADTQTRLINRIAENAYVISVDSDAPLSNRMSYVGASNYGAGMQCGKLVQEALPSGGRIAVLLANLTKDNMVERKRGIEEYLKEAGMAAGAADNAGEQSEQAAEDANTRYEIVEFLLDEGDSKKCVEQLKTLLAERDDINGVVGMNGYHAALMVTATEEAGKLEQVKLIGFDVLEGTLNLIAEGKLYATIAQDPYQYGYQAVGKLCDYCRVKEGNLPLTGVKSTVNISTKTIRKDNVEEFREAHEKQMQKVKQAAG